MNKVNNLSIEDANDLVLEHRGWAESIARSVARSWNMDWQLDGLDGAAMEALIFCARRFDPTRGVPFKGYARKRIHEASTEQARKSKSWSKGIGTTSKAEQTAREVSAELFNIFPELRSGELPYPEESSGGSDGDMRTAVRHMLVGASIAAAKLSMDSALPDELVEYKRMLVHMADLETVHQLILWKVYWEGGSLRSVADEWETDELNVIREHKVLLEYLQKTISTNKRLEKLKIRPGLRPIALKLKKKEGLGPFQEIVNKGT